MKNVMVRAWEIARKAAAQFGGKAAQFIAEALRQAWKEFKAPKQVRVKVEVDGYNSRRWSKPWGAVITFDGARPQYDFKAGSFLGNDTGGAVYITCKPGDVIAYGQKDGRGNGTYNVWMIAMADGSFREVTRTEAYEAWCVA